MRKIIYTILPILLLSFTIHAQRPSKEETQKFISYNLNQVVGQKIGEGETCLENYFSDDFRTQYLKKQVRTSGWLLQTLELIAWENLIKIEVLENDFCGSLLIFFKTKVKGSFDAADPAIAKILKPDYYDRIFVVFPAEKMESMKKAFLTLSEIAKEENKDPFAN